MKTALPITLFLAVAGMTGEAGVMAALEPAPAAPGAPAPAAPGQLSKSLYSMGTLFEITVITADGTGMDVLETAVDQAFESVARLDTLLSTYKPDSEISTINSRAGEGPVKVHPLVLAVLDSSLAYRRLTGGAFDPTVGPLLELWGFRGGVPRVPDAGELAAVLPLVDASGVELDKERCEVRLRRAGQALDLGGIAKGFALDQAAAALRRAGVENALLNFGGNLLFMGEASPGRPWRTGVVHPRISSKVIAKFAASDVAVSTSGDYENYFIAGGERYSHILDPRSGRPAAELCSVTVIAPAGTGSDALSTAIAVLGLEAGMELVESLSGVEAVIVTSPAAAASEQLHVYVSSGMAGRLEPAGGARLLTLPSSGR